MKSPKVLNQSLGYSSNILVDNFQLNKKPIWKKNLKFKIKKTIKKLFDIKRKSSVGNVDLTQITKPVTTKVKIKNQQDEENNIENENVLNTTHVIDSAIFEEYDRAYENSKEKVNAIKREMLQNIEKLIERDANLSDLQEKSCNLNRNIQDLQMTTKRIKRQILKKQHLKIAVVTFLIFLIILISSLYFMNGGDQK
jgi:hypothetical protein